jgi:hypothetical protein
MTINYNNAQLGQSISASGTKETIFISTDNKVGINTNTPSGQLDIIGNTNISGLIVANSGQFNNLSLPSLGTIANPQNSDYLLIQTSGLINRSLISNILLQGSQGTIGSQGSQGVQGPQGVQGRQGTQGVQGTFGSQGTVGSQGTIGSTGSQGSQGVQGTVGSQGTIGSTGSQGVQGLQGVQGTTGSQGTQGLQGTTGSGSQGTQGIKGISSTYSVLIGDGTNTTYTVTHSLGVSSDSFVIVRDTTTNYYVYPDIVYVNNNSIQVIFVSAPTTSQYRVTVIGV